MGLILVLCPLHSDMRHNIGTGVSVHLLGVKLLEIYENQHTDTEICSLSSCNTMQFKSQPNISEEYIASIFMVKT
jgi:hypothetical protein